VDGEQEHWRREHELHVDKLYWMNGSHRKSGWLLVSVVQFVEVFVEERRVIDAMVPVRQIILQTITSILLTGESNII
jgi:hypothetical protein